MKFLEKRLKVSEDAADICDTSQNPPEPPNPNRRAALWRVCAVDLGEPARGAAERA